MNFTIQMSEELLDYIFVNGVREHEVLKICRETTLADERFHIMQISPEQGAFMQMLVKLTGTKRALEIGTFTGYSALAMALAMGPEGRLTCCDMSEEFLSKARTYWQQAGVEDQIETLVGPGVESLDTLLANDNEGAYDLAFIDADKTGYDDYYERCLRLLRQGGLIAIDNVLWSGRVADPKADDEDTKALQALNKKIHGDDRVDMCLAPIADGIMLARKR